MNHWWFVGAAYGLTLAATAALVLGAWRAMRAAERDPK
ncbi:MAG: heme exporter protein CcmD [Sphingomonas sp.]|nr:heme exporter protein CcmD [Sphingomonas sp.]